MDALPPSLATGHLQSATDDQLRTPSPHDAIATESVRRLFTRLVLQDHYTCQQVEKNGGECILWPVDLQTTGACQAVVKKAVDRFGGLDASSTM
ncbi:hypothetical protein FGADI_12468 [Fusarium gaditjirri]|uniref:Uncharacterized protein n=1 Tax=Fusarium gaditjirri TaxID=282569 RepID=A0A8H4WNB1_9HYPO|nr:hypothetical protein FGADI_12468 [Fusarium gaditjirri]